MTHTYQLTGMTCGNCEESVKRRLEAVSGVKAVTVSRQDNEATINMDKHIETGALQEALGGVSGKYRISAIDDRAAHISTKKVTNSDKTDQKDWIETYKPLLIVFAYILGVSLAIQTVLPGFDTMLWMRHFMAGFFLVFSFFKLLDLKGFASAYAGYDIIAGKFYAWGYVYAFVELLLGLAYLVDFQPVLTYAVTFVVMSVSIVGVIQSVLNKTRIQCACLGTGFNLPMSTVTIIEDGLMIAMSAVMLIALV